MIFFSFNDQPKAVSAANAANQLTDREPLAKPHEAPVSELAELADQPPLDRASRLAELRRKRCMALGIAADVAEQLAHRLRERDSDRDDRRLCVECRHCRRSGCAVRDAWLPTMLQRCDNFAAAVLEVAHE